MIARVAGPLGKRRRHVSTLVVLGVVILPPTSQLKWERSGIKNQHCLRSAFSASDAHALGL